MYEWRSNDHFFRCFIQMLGSTPPHPSIQPLPLRRMTSPPLATLPLAPPTNKCCLGRHPTVSLATRSTTGSIYGHNSITQLTGNSLTVSLTDCLSDWLTVCLTLSSCLFLSSWCPTEVSWTTRWFTMSRWIMKTSLFPPTLTSLWRWEKTQNVLNKLII